MRETICTRPFANPLRLAGGDLLKYTRAVNSFHILLVVTRANFACNPKIFIPQPDLFL